MSNFPNFSSHNYQVIEELGRNREGGRISYLASKQDSEEKVVIKQFRFAIDASWQGFKTYQREIQILQELNHPRIPKYIDSFETSDGFCMVQEYKNAPSLFNRRSFTPAAIEQIAVSILEILVDLQTRIPPLIHRDIKPENILVDEQNQAYLIDFGISRLKSEEFAASSVAAGTPGFMPPEELFSRPLTTASDLYSLGATLICLLTNTSSIDISKLIDENYRFKFKHLVGEIDPRLIAWVTKMVEPNSSNRFANAKVALEALKTLDLVNLNDRPSLAQSSKPKLLQYQTTGFVTLIISVTSFLGIGIVRGLLKGLNSQSSQTISSGSSAIARSTISTSEEQWFNQIKPRCNSVEVATAIKSSPPPDTYQGVGYAAGCYALAGKIDKADNLIAQLPANLRPAATYIVFNIGHPVADAGDDESARPIMALVVKYWSENYMAMYHLGMSEYVLKDYQNSKRHLNEFLNMYQTEDGWRQNAITVLGYIDRGVETTPPQSNE